MTYETLKHRVRATVGLDIAIGVWLFVSTWIFRDHYSPAGAWNGWITGVVIALLALIQLSERLNLRMLGVLNILLGVWIFVSPWVYGYTARRVGS